MRGMVGMVTKEAIVCENHWTLLYKAHKLGYCGLCGYTVEFRSFSDPDPEAPWQRSLRRIEKGEEKWRQQCGQ